MKGTIPGLLVLLLLAAPAAVQAQSGSGSNFNYTINSGNTNTITLTAYTGTNKVVMIPTNINGLTVTSLANGGHYAVFSPEIGVTSVSIPNSVTSIGAYAFVLCAKLTNVTLTNGVTSIGVKAFASTGLTNVIIPSSVTSIAGYAFQDCLSLTNVTIADGVATIGDSAFYSCSKLPSVTIPSTVTNIGDDVFEDCTRLTSIAIDAQNAFYSSTNGVLFNENQTELIQFPDGLGGSYTIPSSVTSIGQDAFIGTALSSVSIPGGVTSIPFRAFYVCSSLTNATIANGVTSIGEYAFFGTGLTGVIIPSSVTIIGPAAFQECMSLTSVTIPSTVTNIGSVAFQDCRNLTNILFTGNAPTVGSDVFDGGYGAPPTYYLPGTTGWSYSFWEPPGGGPSAVLWNPLIQTGDGSFGLRNNQFGFNITGTNNFTVVVEACTNLACPVWTPLTNVTLTNGSFYFSDPQWTNYPGRYYGLGFP